MTEQDIYTLYYEHYLERKGKTYGEDHDSQTSLARDASYSARRATRILVDDLKGVPGLKEAVRSLIDELSVPEQVTRSE